MSIFNIGTNLGLTGGKYLIKIIFYVKIEIGMSKILNVANFNKFWELLIFGRIWAEEVVREVINKNNFGNEHGYEDIWNIKGAKFQ